jgi:bile acid-coenzyme A ligase
VGETSFGEELGRLAALDAARPALTFGDQTVGRAELCDRAERLAARFAELGVTAGSTVTIGLPNSIEFVESMLASWLLGAAPQPISDRLPARERTAIIELAGPALVIGVGADEAGGRPALEAVPEELSSGSRGIDRAVSPVWKIVTSGGSTGRPKLIMATQPALVENVAGFCELLRLPTDGSVLVTGPMSHNAPFIVAILGLLKGNHVVLMPRFDASESLRLVERHRVQWLYLVPTMMLRIWRLPEEERLGRDLSSLEVAYHRAVPPVAQAGVDRLARARRRVRALRRDRAAGNDGHHRPRVARAPRLGRAPGHRRDRGAGRRRALRAAAGGR